MFHIINTSRKMFTMKYLLSFLLAVASLNAVDYEKEYETEYEATKKGDIFGKEYIPTKKELEGYPQNFDMEKIKILLPLDLKRIFDEYKMGKPISLAVACGDRELPWRSYFAAKSNDSSRPNLNDFWEHLKQDRIDYKQNNENSISLDLYLAFNQNIEGRGAGHILMNVGKKTHWEQLFEFFKKQNVEISQIIFTAMAGFSEDSIENEPDELKTYLNFLKKGGKLVRPYFSPIPLSGSVSGEYFELSGFLTSLFNDEKIKSAYYRNKELGVDGKKHLKTNYTSFLDFAVEKDQGKIIKLVDEKYPKASKAYKDFLKELAIYCISNVDLTKFKNLTNKSYVPDIFKDISEEEKIKQMIPIYNAYYKAKGYNVQFLTNPQWAKKIGSEFVKAQEWKPGDYPYGERDNIALILVKE